MDASLHVVNIDSLVKRSVGKILKMGDSL